MSNYKYIASSGLDFMEKKSNFYIDGLAYDAQLEAREQTEIGKEFFLWAIETYGDPVLELGCGSGRLTLQFAKKGYSVVGLDLSQGLLDDAIIKTLKENLSIEFTQGDMSNFHLNKKFKLILTTGFAFMHLYTNESLYSHFECIREHLESDGLYIFETFNPNFIQLTKFGPDEMRPYAEYDDPRTGKHVNMTQSNAYNPLTQVNEIRFKIDMEGEISYQETHMRMIFPQELNMLLDFQNFEVIEKFGNYKREKFEDNPFLQIVVCKPNVQKLKL